MVGDVPNVHCPVENVQPTVGEVMMWEGVILYGYRLWKLEGHEWAEKDSW